MIQRALLDDRTSLDPLAFIHGSEGSPGSSDLLYLDRMVNILTWKTGCELESFRLSDFGGMRISCIELASKFLMRCFPSSHIMIRTWFDQRSPIPRPNVQDQDLDSSALLDIAISLCKNPRATNSSRYTSMHHQARGED